MLYRFLEHGAEIVTSCVQVPSEPGRRTAHQSSTHSDFVYKPGRVAGSVVPPQGAISLEKDAVWF